MSRFLNNGEGQKYLCEGTGVSDCKSWREIKIFPGQDFLVYNYDFTWEFNVLTVVRVSDISINSAGIRIKFIDKSDSSIFTVGNIPTPIAGYDVFAQVPQTCSIERTLKKLDDDTVHPNIACYINLIHRTNKHVSLDQDYAMPVTLARHVGLADGEFEKCCNAKGYFFNY